MIVDVIREVKPPFSPERVCAEFAALCKVYGVTKVVGDRYAGEWPKEQFGKFGIMYEQSAKPKSELYLDLLAAINSKRVQLLDHPKLINQLLGLERRTSRSGRDSIDHISGGHDDLSNCVAGLCAETISKYGNYDTSYHAWSGEPDLDAPKKATAATKPVRADDHWWDDGTPTPPTTDGGRAERLRAMYDAFETFTQWGPQQQVPFWRRR
jgi:hypothetical protein